MNRSKLTWSRMIKTFRKEHGLTVDQLATKLTVSKSVLERGLNGEPSEKLISAVQRVYPEYFGPAKLSEFDLELVQSDRKFKKHYGLAISTHSERTELLQYIHDNKIPEEVARWFIKASVLRWNEKQGAHIKPVHLSVECLFEIFLLIVGVASGSLLFQLYLTPVEGPSLLQPIALFALLGVGITLFLTYQRWVGPYALARAWDSEIEHGYSFDPNQPVLARFGATGLLLVLAYQRILSYWRR